jgi:broad specificity phosphatase PhoE
MLLYRMLLFFRHNSCRGLIRVQDRDRNCSDHFSRHWKFAIHMTATGPPDIDGKPALKMLLEVIADGVEHTVMIMSHAERTQIPDIAIDDSLLTEQGVTTARTFGQSLPRALTVRGYSSPSGYCVQTSDCILEGHQEEGGNVTPTRAIDGLKVFHVLDDLGLDKPDATDSHSEAVGEGAPDSDIVIHPKTTARILASLAVAKLKSPMALPQLDLLVSHDRNLCPLVEYLLQQPISKTGGVRNLDAIGFYTLNDVLMVRSPYGEAVALQP